MKEGDTVVCINPLYTLTIGKKYIVMDFVLIEDRVNSISIIDDSGDEGHYFMRRFKTIKEYRKEKLNRILK